jgi:hypothetical protein
MLILKLMQKKKALAYKPFDEAVNAAQKALN